MDNQQERPELNMYWFAGFFEAEGWISLMDTKRKENGEKISRYVPTCGICNTDFHVFDSIQLLLQKNGIKYQPWIRQPRKKGHKLGWQIHFSGMKKCITFLEWVIPFMQSGKKKKAELVLKFCKQRKEKIHGFCGISYSQEDLDLFNNISSGILNDYTPNMQLA